MQHHPTCVTLFPTSQNVTVSSLFQMSCVQRYFKRKLDQRQFPYASIKKYKKGETKKRKKKDLEFNTQRLESKQNKKNCYEDEKKLLEHDQQELVVITGKDGASSVENTKIHNLRVILKLRWKATKNPVKKQEKPSNFFAKPQGLFLLSGQTSAIWFGSR